MPSPFPLIQKLGPHILKNRIFNRNWVLGFIVFYRLNVTRGRSYINTKTYFVTWFTPLNKNSPKKKKKNHSFITEKQAVPKG